MESPHQIHVRAGSLELWGFGSCLYHDGQDIIFTLTREAEVPCHESKLANTSLHMLLVPLGAVCPHINNPLTQILHLQQHDALLCHWIVRRNTSPIPLNGLCFPPSPPVKQRAASGAVGPTPSPNHPNATICAPFPPFSPSHTLLVALDSFQAHNCFSNSVLLPQYPVFLIPPWCHS